MVYEPESNQNTSETESNRTISTQCHAITMLILAGLGLAIVTSLNAYPIHAWKAWIGTTINRIRFVQSGLVYIPNTHHHVCDDTNFTNVGHKALYRSVDWLDYENRNCSVPVYVHRAVEPFHSHIVEKQFETAATSRNAASKRRALERCHRTHSVPCTNTLFNDYFTINSRFVSSGFWELEPQNVAQQKIRIRRFQPEFCSFTEQPLSSDFVRNCFLNKGVKRIVSMGDSNGNRTFQGLLEAVSSVASCQLVKREKSSFIAELEYYFGNISVSDLDWRKKVKIHRRDCRTCTGRQFRCLYPCDGSKDDTRCTSAVILEHVSMTKLSDRTITVQQPIASHIQVSSSTQEFLVRDYLLRDGFPDVLVVITPFIHEINSGTAVVNGEGIRPSLRYLLRLIKQYAPVSRRTDVYWVPSHRTYGLERRHINERLIECNNVLYNVLKEEMQHQELLGKGVPVHAGSMDRVGFEGDRKEGLPVVGVHVHGFLDLFTLSCPLRRLTGDGDRVHMKSNWYNILARHLLELHCNS